MTQAFFDTNVIVYALVRDGDPRHLVADRLLADHMVARTLVLSTQVLQETYSVLTRKKRFSIADAHAAVRALAEERVLGSDRAFVLRSLTLADRHRLSMWDALIVQAALDADCDVLYTEDLQAGRRFDGLEVVNPLLPATHEPAAVFAAVTQPSTPTSKPLRARRLPASSKPAQRKTSA